MSRESDVTKCIYSNICLFVFTYCGDIADITRISDTTHLIAVLIIPDALTENCMQQG